MGGHVKIIRTASLVEQGLDVPAFVIDYRGVTLLVQSAELQAAERLELGTALLTAACARRPPSSGSAHRDGGHHDRVPS